MTFTQLPYAATMPTRVDSAAEKMNYQAITKSKMDSGIAVAAIPGAK